MTPGTANTIRYQCIHKYTKQDQTLNPSLIKKRLPVGLYSQNNVTSQQPGLFTVISD